LRTTSKKAFKIHCFYKSLLKFLLYFPEAVISHYQFIVVLMRQVMRLLRKLLIFKANRLYLIENTLIRNQQKAQQMYVKWDTKSKHMPLVLESSIISLPLRHRQRRWSLRLYLVNKLPTLAASLTGFSHKVEGTLLTIFLRCQLPEQVYRSKSWKTFRFWVCNDKEWQAIR